MLFNLTPASLPSTEEIARCCAPPAPAVATIALAIAVAHGGYYRPRPVPEHPIFTGGEDVDSDDGPLSLEHWLAARGSTPEQQVAQNAYLIDAMYNLKREHTGSQNWGGQNEKWLRNSNNQWFFVLPDGGLYRWHGGTPAEMLQNAVQIVSLDASVYENIQWLLPSL